MAKSATAPRRIEFKTNKVIRKNRRAQKLAFDQLAKEMQRAIRAPLRKGYPPASSPGQPPRKRTGFLAQNTIVDRKGRTLLIRTPLYGVFLDGGTSRMAARPFIRVRIHDQRKRWSKRMSKLYAKFQKAGV